MTKFRLTKTGSKVGKEFMFRLERYTGWFWGWSTEGYIWATDMDTAEKFMNDEYQREFTVDSD